MCVERVKGTVCVSIFRPSLMIEPELHVLPPLEPICRMQQLIHQLLRSTTMQPLACFRANWWRAK